MCRHLLDKPIILRCIKRHALAVLFTLAELTIGSKFIYQTVSFSCKTAMFGRLAGRQSDSRVVTQENAFN